MESNKIRKLFLDYFKSKNHNIIPSASIVVKDDPTLLFTNAGMNQFKDIFVNSNKPPYSRVVNSQKCLRVSGKHNDLEQVGHDTYHHTMFEMLGSWSFGDYFKKEAINWAWEFLINICNLDPNRMYVTYFEGCSNDGTEKDIESYDIWKELLPEDRIIAGNKKDNFWEMGDVGPCGPCSEIHFDNRSEKERALISGKDLVNQDHPQVIEIWNLVFMQFNRSSDGILMDLPYKHVDTGMGFERLTMIMQKVNSNYETDIFRPIISKIQQISNLIYGKEEKIDVAMRVIADHVRAVSFSIADGQLPSNTKAGYVVRRILRRAIRYGYTYLALESAFIYKLVDVLITNFGSYYKELNEQKDLIINVIKEEEESFLQTLEDGLKKIQQIIIGKKNEVPAKDVFELYDTYGFPSDLTKLILQESKLTFNEEEFNICMQEQRDRSKKASKRQVGDWKVLISDEKVRFIGYAKLESKLNILKYRKVENSGETEFHLVFNKTPFYPQSGGQVGDIGDISNENEIIEVLDCRKENQLIIHIVKKLPQEITSEFTAKVNKRYRKNISRNHSATHLLHESLRDILGNHVEQKGSLVDNKHLRFDFTHFRKIDDNIIKKIENHVNNKILSNIELIEHKEVLIEEAKSMGAIMLFSEKYEEKVRMIQFGSSIELCGGTHVKSTAEIGPFKILSEGSVASGIRRIEACTGEASLDYLNNQTNIVDELSTLLKSKDIRSSVENLIAKNKELEKQIQKLNTSALSEIRNKILSEAIIINEIRFIAKKVDLNMQSMKDISFSLRKEKSLFLLLASKIDNKVILSLLISEDLISNEGLNASVIIQDISREINGGGGGQSFFATAGGDKFNGIQNAFLKAKDYVNT